MTETTGHYTESDIFASVPIAMNVLRKVRSNVIEIQELYLETCKSST